MTDLIQYVTDQLRRGRVSDLADQVQAGTLSPQDAQLAIAQATGNQDDLMQGSQRSALAKIAGMVSNGSTTPLDAYGQADTVTSNPTDIAQRKAVTNALQKLPVGGNPLLSLAGVGSDVASQTGDTGLLAKLPQMIADLQAKQAETNKNNYEAGMPVNDGTAPALDPADKPYAPIAPRGKVQSEANQTRIGEMTKETDNLNVPAMQEAAKTVQRIAKKYPGQNWSTPYISAVQNAEPNVDITSLAKTMGQGDVIPPTDLKEMLAAQSVLQAAAAGAGRPPGLRVTQNEFNLLTQPGTMLGTTPQAIQNNSNTLLGSIHAKALKPEFYQAYANQWGGSLDKADQVYQKYLMDNDMFTRDQSGQVTSLNPDTFSAKGYAPYIQKAPKVYRGLIEGDQGGTQQQPAAKPAAQQQQQSPQDGIEERRQRILQEMNKRKMKLPAGQ